MIPTERPVVPFPNIVPTEPTAGRRVLLVDDDDTVRDMMTATLERKGFGVLELEVSVTKRACCEPIRLQCPFSKQLMSIVVASSTC